MHTKKKQSCIRSVLNVILRNWSVLLCFEMFYRGIGFLFLFPLIRYLLSLLPGLTGEVYLGQDNIFLILEHPLAVLLLIGILLLAGSYIYFEITAFFLYSENGWNQKTVTIWGLWKEAAGKAASLLQPKRLPVFLLLPVLLLSVFSLLSGYMQNFIFPEFILEFLKGNLVLAGIFVAAIFLFHLLLFQYLFGFPSLLFQGNSFKDSWKESRSLLKHKKLRMAGKLIFYFFSFLLAMIAITVVFVLVLAGFVEVIYETLEARSQFQLYFSKFQGVWTIVSGAITSVFFCALIVVLYHQRREEIPPEKQILPKNIRKRLIRAATVFATFALLLVFSESELGGRAWYPGFPTEIIAHRAGATFAPENTLAALQMAIDHGASIAEIDVQQLKDNTLIVLHDSNLKRITGLDKNVWEVDYETVQKLDAGSHFSERFAGEPIPTLEAFLIAAKDKIQLMIELKATGYENNLVENTLALIEQYGMQKQCMIASMDRKLLEQAKKQNPEIPTVYITVLLFSGNYNLKDLDAYSVETTSLTSGLVLQAHLQDKKVYAWTANSEDTIDKILRCGADGIVTDNPLLAENYIREVNENLWINELTDLFFPKID